MLGESEKYEAAPIAKATEPAADAIVAEQQLNTWTKENQTTAAKQMAFCGGGSFPQCVPVEPRLFQSGCVITPRCYCPISSGMK